MSRNLLRLFGIVVFVLILQRIDLYETFSLLKEAKAFYILCAILLFFPTHFIITWRWNLLLKLQEIKINFSELLQAYAVISYFALITPARIGDFGRAVYLKKKGYSFSKALFGVVVDRVLDLIFVTLLALLGMAIFLPSHTFKLYLLLSILVVSSLLFLRKKLVKRCIKFIVRHTVPQKYRRLSEENIAQFHNDLQRLKSKTAYLLFMGVLGTWTLHFFGRYLMALSLGIKISPVHLIAIIALCLFVSILPISIFGIGTRDLTLIFFFSQIGLEKEEAVAFSILILGLTLLNTFFYLAIWLVKPIRIE